MIVGFVLITLKKLKWRLIRVKRWAYVKSFSIAMPPTFNICAIQPTLKTRSMRSKPVRKKANGNNMFWKTFWPVVAVITALTFGAPLAHSAPLKDDITTYHCHTYEGGPTVEITVRIVDGDYDYPKSYDVIVFDKGAIYFRSKQFTHRSFFGAEGNYYWTGLGSPVGLDNPYGALYFIFGQLENPNWSGKYTYQERNLNSDKVILNATCALSSQVVR
jgi:hypothetical protein